MPLTAQEIAAARPIVRDATSGGDFKAKANASSVKWWNASATDLATLITESAQDDVKQALKTYARQLTFNAAAEYFRTHVIPQDDKGRAYWLQYYLLEVQNAFARGKGDIDFANRLLAYTKPSGVDIEWKHGDIEHVPNTLMKDSLTQLMSWGFDRIPLDCDGMQTGDGDLAHLSDCVRVNSGDEVYKCDWRSDSRAYGEIVDADGFQAKARSESFAKSHGMREPWHPLSDPAQRKFMWFRKTQKDNCLYSLVSIGGEKGGAAHGPDFRAYLPFPLLHDYPQHAHKTKVFCQVGPRHEWTWLELGVSSTWLYLFATSNLVMFDTAKAQQKRADPDPHSEHHGSFPENGAAGIPLENIYGAVRFLRIHHGPAPSDSSAGQNLDIKGLTAMPVEICLSSHQLFSRRMKWGSESKNQIAPYFDTAAAHVLTSVRWTPTGYEPIAPVFQLDNTEVRLSTLSFKELRNISA